MNRLTGERGLPHSSLTWTRVLIQVLKTLRKHAYMIWVVGNRRIAGRQLPTDAILHELLVARNSVPVVEICRDIPTKRMALKNSVTSTMIKEKILVFRHTGVS